MNTYNYTLGIDVSKKTVDICLKKQLTTLYEAKIENNTTGLNLLKKELKKREIAFENVLFCSEDCGIYLSQLQRWAQKNHINLWVGSALAIKKSMGLVRGKSDKIDADRIATYAYRHQDRATMWQPKNPVIVEIESLWHARERLVKMRTQTKSYLTEVKAMQGKATYSITLSHVSSTLKAIEKDLKAITAKLKAALAKDPVIQRQHEVITSIDGVGTATATYLIALTNGFQRLHTPRQLACYAGIAPFPHTSGSSIRGKTRVSYFANKKLKSLLHLCTVSLLRMKNNFTHYVERKKAEGKHTMSLLNALRNKLVHVICACIKNDKKYDKNYLHKP